MAYGTLLKDYQQSKLDEVISDIIINLFKDEKGEIVVSYNDEWILENEVQRFNLKTSKIDNVKFERDPYSQANSNCVCSIQSKNKTVKILIVKDQFEIVPVM